MLLADGFATTVAPAIVANVLGGTGTQRSSQISTASTKSGRSDAANSRSAPNGTPVRPRSVTVSKLASRAALKCRFS
jgi:hypothetical protein